LHDAAYFCRGRWRECSAPAASNGVRYLRRVQGRPRNGPGPGNCGRVSCSYKSETWWCNDGSDYLINALGLETYNYPSQSVSPHRLGGFNNIDDGVAFILDEFVRNLWTPPQYGEVVSGQAFHKNNWNVIVRYDNDHC
jgi:hypothetical protein